MVDTVINARGMIYWRKEPKGYRQQGILDKARPVLVVSNNDNNCYSNIVTVIPITSTDSHSYLPTHISIKLPTRKSVSYLVCEQISLMQKCDLGSYIATVTNDKMAEIEEGIKIALGMVAYSSSKSEEISGDEQEKKHAGYKRYSRDYHKQRFQPSSILTTSSGDDKSIDLDKNNADVSTDQNSTKSEHKLRRKFTEEQRIEYLVDYEAVSQGTMSKEELLSKWGIDTYSYATQTFKRFKRVLGV